MNRTSNNEKRPTIVQTMTTWNYLPAQPPEPPASRYGEYLAAAEVYCNDVTLEIVGRAWWGGSNIGWITEKSEPLEIYAWANWPIAPPMRDQR